MGGRLALLAKASCIAHPAPKRETSIEKANIREPGFAQNGLVLLGGQNGQFLTDACTSGLPD